jgi:hypothetical protein
VQTTTQEQWAETQYTGYQASDAGRVAKVDEDGQRRILSQHRTEKDYLRVSIKTPSGEWRTVRVHRLVAAAFYGDHPGLDVNHLNGLTDDNAAGNLTWATRRENMRHAVLLGLLSYAKLQPTDIPVIRGLKGIESAKQVAARYGVSDRAIRDVWSGRRWADIPWDSQPSLN